MVLYISYRLIQHPNLSSLLGVVPISHSKMAIITQLVRGASLNEHLFGDARKVSPMIMYVLVHYITVNNYYTAVCDGKVVDLCASVTSGPFPSYICSTSGPFGYQACQHIG